MKPELIQRYRFSYDLKTRYLLVRLDNRIEHNGASIIGGCVVVFHIGTREEAIREGVRQTMHYNQYGELKR